MYFHGNETDISVIESIFSGNDQQNVYFDIPIRFSSRSFANQIKAITGLKSKRPKFFDDFFGTNFRMFKMRKKGVTAINIIAKCQVLSRG